MYVFATALRLLVACVLKRLTANYWHKTPPRLTLTKLKMFEEYHRLTLTQMLHSLHRFSYYPTIIYFHIPQEIICQIAKSRSQWREVLKEVLHKHTFWPRSIEL